MTFRTIVIAAGIAMIAVGCAAPGVKLPGESGADSTLQRDALQFVMLMDGAADNVCKQRKVINTEITEHPNNPGKAAAWTERWTVDRCGTQIDYKVVFTPTPKIGGTDISVSVWKDQ